VAQSRKILRRNGYGSYLGLKTRGHRVCTMPVLNEVDGPSEGIKIVAFFAGLLLPFGIDFIERIFEARGCESRYRRLVLEPVLAACPKPPLRRSQKLRLCKSTCVYSSPPRNSSASQSGRAPVLKQTYQRLSSGN
jgi:hypothetical protein